MNNKLAYTIPEAAEVLSISRTHLYALHRQGRVRFKKLGKRTVVTHEELLRVLEAAADE